MTYKGIWHQADQIYVTPYRLQPPYDNIYVGPYPSDGMTHEYAIQFDAIVNVSDSPDTYFEPARPNQSMHWYPVNEMGLWNLSYLYWLKKVMDYHYDKGHKIYLHCAAGAYRSPSAAVLWLQSRGHSPEEALRIGSFRGDKSGVYRLWKGLANIPKLKDKVFNTMREHPSWGLGSILLYKNVINYDKWNKEIMAGESRKRHLLFHYFWFWYRPKFWIKDKWRYLKYWLKGNGWYSEGCGTQIYKRKKFWVLSKNAEPATGVKVLGLNAPR